jgi:uncharacterized membrane protein
MTTTTTSPDLSPLIAPRIVRWGAILLMTILFVAFVRRAASGLPYFPTVHGLWLILHLATVIPAIPLGAYVLLKRKGDARHKRLGRIWAVLMLATALSSFGLTGMTGNYSPIHLLSILVLVTLPRAIWDARRGRMAGHRRTMTILYASLVIAGLFTFLPGRMFGIWLFG